MSNVPTIRTHITIRIRSAHTHITALRTTPHQRLVHGAAALSYPCACARNNGWVKGKTYATAVLARLRVRGCLSSEMVAPSLTPNVFPQSTLNSDVFPAPDGPMMHATCMCCGYGWSARCVPRVVMAHERRVQRAHSHGTQHNNALVVHCGMLQAHAVVPSSTL